MESGKSGIKRSRVDFTRDFPPGCGPISNSTLKRPSVRDGNRHFPSGCGTNISPKITQNSPRKDSCQWRRKVCAVRSKPCLPPKLAETGETKQRKRVLEMLRLFRERCGKISNVKRVDKKRVDTKAYTELKIEGKVVNHPSLMIGSVPGVEVGDRFSYRIELVIVGLHRRFQGGIDSMEFGGSKFATCIVANEGHFDKLNDPNVLIYVGEGGVLQRGDVGVPPDQQLKGGNRALWNSMKDKKPVRVVRGIKLSVSGRQRMGYVYDGLYSVEACEKKKGPQGNFILEFRLVRNAGQTTVPWRNCRWGCV